MYRIVRTDSLDINKVNSTNNCGGRFGNIFIRNFVAEYIAKKNNLKMTYERYDQFEKLGIKLFIGTNVYDETLVITDEIIDSIIFDDNIFNTYCRNRNILFRNVDYNPFSLNDYAWCQTSSIVSYIRNVVDYESRVINNNPYKERYGNNNDMFIHLRLGDIVNFNFNVSIDYYDSIIQRILDSDNYKNSPYFNSGVLYITSDSIDHDICKRLINKYNLRVYDSDEIDTIQFGSTCQSIVLSNGTYSWLLGLLSFRSNVHYPTIKVKWHGNIFIYPDWHEVGY
jgi:hypothetical protein